MLSTRRRTRTLFATVSGFALAGALIAAWPTKDEDANRNSPGYVPPTTWVGMPPFFVQKFLGWDQKFWNLEVNGQERAVLGFVTEVMESYGNDSLKPTLAYFAHSSGRHYLLDATVKALDPAISAPGTRDSILSEVWATLHFAGAQVIPAQARSAILEYHASGIEAEAMVRDTLAAVVELL